MNIKTLLLAMLLLSSLTGHSKETIVDCVLKDHPELMESNLEDMKTAITEYNAIQDDNMEMLSDQDTLTEAIKNQKNQSNYSVQGTLYEFCSKLTKEQEEAVSIFEEFVACEDNLDRGTDKKVCKDFDTYSKYVLSKPIEGNRGLVKEFVQKIKDDIRNRGLEEKIALRQKANDALID